jgi:hypothetical protein
MATKAKLKPVEIVTGYCTGESVAAYLGLSEQMVRRYRTQLRGVSVCGGTLYPVWAVVEFQRPALGRPKKGK